MAKENVFGLPVEVYSSREEAAQAVGSEPTVYAVMRCADLPSWNIPAPVRARNLVVGCKVCKQSCWLDPKAWVPGTIVTCNHCLPADYEIHALRETVDEVRRYYPGV
jgi:hypothetical protein